MEPELLTTFLNEPQMKPAKIKSLKHAIFDAKATKMFLEDVRDWKKAVMKFQLPKSMVTSVC